jgi:hypothetical protein
MAWFKSRKKIQAESGWQPIFDWGPMPSRLGAVILGVLVAVAISLASAYVLRVAPMPMVRSMQENYQITYQRGDGGSDALQDEVIFPAAALTLPTTEWPDVYRASYRAYQPVFETWPRHHAPQVEVPLTNFYDVVLPPVTPEKGEVK